MFIKYIIKSLLKNKAVWFWGVMYVIIWLLMGVFLWSSTVNKEYLKEYAGIWYAIDSIFSISFVSVSLSYGMYYSSTSLAYLFKNSSLKPSKYYFNYLISVGLFFVIIGTVLEFIETILFKIKFGIIILPSNFYLSILLFFVSGIIFYSFSIVLVILINNYVGLKNISFVSFIPMILGMFFGYSALYVKIPDYLLYTNFYTPTLYLYLYSYVLKTPWIILSDPFSGNVNLDFCILSLLIWLAILIFMSIYLLTKIRASDIEEARIT